MPRTKLLANTVTAENFLTLEELHKKLGAGYSPRTLKRLIQKGSIKQGEHFIRTSGNTGIIKVNLEAFQAFILSLNSF